MGAGMGNTHEQTRKYLYLLMYLEFDGAVEKTRTSTGVTPQRPQRCASTNSATTALALAGMARCLPRGFRDAKSKCAALCEKVRGALNRGPFEYFWNNECARPDACMRGQGQRSHHAKLKPRWRRATLREITAIRIKANTA